MTEERLRSKAENVLIQGELVISDLYLICFYALYIFFFLKSNPHDKLTSKIHLGGWKYFIIFTCGFV